MLSFNHPQLLAFFSPGLPEMMIVGLVALLLFGKRLPEVARSFGKSMVEFKKGISSIETEVDSTRQFVDDAAESERIVVALKSRDASVTDSPSPACSKHFGQTPAGASAGSSAPHLGQVFISTTVKILLFRRLLSLSDGKHEHRNSLS